MSGAVGKRLDHVPREHLGESGVEVQPAALDELEHHDGDERLQDAAGPEPVVSVHRDLGSDPAQAGGAGPAAELRAAHVEDRSGGAHARIASAARRSL